MESPAIRIKDLGKCYVIHHEARHDNLRDTLHESIRGLARRFQSGSAFSQEEFWALRGLSFSVQPGEVLGIVGRNGAGKSTLLKLISRITEPSTGSIELSGRVASLLEVGTGFHPELTGRENIFLNGAILGMSRREIAAKFDEIVEFAEVERFLDTPVKRYSSGMYVRLAFAVAAHLEPEILVIDEVLAVGDTRFQKKCLGKMEDVSRSHHRTILFVSHQLATIRTLCPRSILLEKGGLTDDGPTAEILARYEGEDAVTNGEIRLDREPVKGIKVFSAAITVDPAGESSEYHQLSITLEGDAFNDAPQAGLAVHIDTLDGLRIAHLGPRILKVNIEPGRGGWRSEVKIPDINRYLAGGRYQISLLFQEGTGGSASILPRPVVVEIPDADPFGAGIYFTRASHGLVPLPARAHIQPT